MNLLFVPSFSPSRLLSCSDHASAIQESGGLKKEEIPNFNCRAHENQCCRILWGHFIFILHSRTILNYAIASYRDSQQDLLIASFFHVGSLSIQYSIWERSTSKMLQFLIDKTMNCTIQFWQTRAKKSGIGFLFPLLTIPNPNRLWLSRHDFITPSRHTEQRNASVARPSYCVTLRFWGRRDRVDWVPRPCVAK